MNGWTFFFGFWVGFVACMIYVNELYKNGPRP